MGTWTFAAGPPWALSGKLRVDGAGVRYSQVSPRNATPASPSIFPRAPKDTVAAPLGVAPTSKTYGPAPVPVTLLAGTPFTFRSAAQTFLTLSENDTAICESDV